MANFVLKDINGNESTYSRDKILVDTAEGGTQIFSEGVAVEGVEIALDFSDGGDQTVIAPDGTLVKSAIILKPENLKPENIKKDEVVAGIVGEFEGGGGIDLEGLEYFPHLSYQIDFVRKEIIFCAVSYEKLFEQTGAYDMVFPSSISDFAVVIDASF